LFAYPASNAGRRKFGRDFGIFPEFSEQDRHIRGCSQKRGTPLAQNIYSNNEIRRAPPRTAVA
jgi:hypothetical protein